MNPVYNVPSEPSSLTYMLTGIGTLAIYMWYTGLWRNGLRPKKPAPVVSTAYEYCDYERRFAHAFGSLTVDRLSETKPAMRPVKLPNEQWMASGI